MLLDLILFLPSSLAMPVIKASIAAFGATERTSFEGHLDKPIELNVVYEPPNFLIKGKLFFIKLKNPSASERITLSHSSYVNSLIHFILILEPVALTML